MEVDEEDYRRGVKQVKFSVIGRMSLQHGDLMPTTIEVKTKLTDALRISISKSYR